MGTTNNAKRWNRTASTAVRFRRHLLLLATGLAMLLLLPAPASAFKIVADFGEGAGKVNQPYGTAVDFETGRLYVADRFNHRVDVFDAAGNFEKAFGWGVKDGKAELQVCTSKCLKGIAGSGSGQFDQPQAIAVDNDPASPSHHAVYVVDSENLRIQKFDPDGSFILTFGGGVDKTDGGDLCTAASGHVCGAGSEGFSEGEFEANASRGLTRIYVAVGPDGEVYVVDNQSGTPAQSRLQRYQPSGAQISPQYVLREFEGERNADTFGFAVDSFGDLYVANNRVYKYELTPGGPVGMGSGDSWIDEQVFALAVDPADNLYATVGETVINGQSAIQHLVEYTPNGTPLRRFAYGSFTGIGRGIAPYSSATGAVYAADVEGNKVLHLDFPPPGPVVFSKPCEANPLGNTEANLRAHVNPEGKATTYHFQYITEADYQANGGSFSGANPATSTPESASVGAGFKMHAATAEVALTPSTEYRCRVVATNADGVTTGPEGQFTSLAPLEIGAVWPMGVTTETATLHGEVNPLGIATTGYFEYVDEATYEKDIAELGPGHGFDHALKAPDVGGGAQPLDFEDGESFKALSATAAGLTPGTAYRFRIVASDPYFPDGLPGDSQVFHTFRPGAGGLLDERAYELVSPAQKEGAEVGVPGVAGGLLQQFEYTKPEVAASSGEAITYASWTSFGDPSGAPGASQYLSRRGPAGWSTENISPAGIQFNPTFPAYRGFNPEDLGTAGFFAFKPPLVPGAVEEVENLYLRDNASGAIKPLTIEPPQMSLVGGNEVFCTAYAGSSADGKLAFFAANGAMGPAPVGAGFSLYEWSASGGLRLASILPDGTPAQPYGQTTNGTWLTTEANRFGREFGACKSGHGIVANAISADGSRAFWNYGGEYEGAKRPLFVRIDGSETVQLDAPAPKAQGGGKGPAGEGSFWAATPDGSMAFFEAPGKLIAGAPEGSLYRYDTVSRVLVNLVSGSIAPNVQGVIGASEDGSYLYFVAKGALTGTQQGPGGEQAADGQYNLYVWHEGEGVRFIARLVEDDESTWDSDPSRLTARVTPDGRHLAFLSAQSEALTDYDSLLAGGGLCGEAINEPLGELRRTPHCAQAFIYEAETDHLTCASCNPSGARPLGPTKLPVWSNPFGGPRYLSADGTRLFFESRDALVPADQNGKRDVYEFERAGAGACDSANPNFVPSSGGCISLISSGRSSDESFLIDASDSGRDVFFSTRDPLVGWDDNPNYDIYDARIGGGFPEPPPQPPICAGEGCKPTAAPPTAGISPPGTAGFQGPGNLSGHCPKGKVRRQGRCTKPPCPKGKVRRQGSCTKPRPPKGTKRHGDQRQVERGIR